MSYEFTYSHNAWAQRVAQETARSKWFYQTLPTTQSKPSRSVRWKQLSHALSHPDYRTNYEYMRTKSRLDLPKATSRAETLGRYFNDVNQHQDKLRFIFDREWFTERSKAETDRPRYHKDLPTRPKTSTALVRKHAQPDSTKPLQQSITLSSKAKKPDEQLQEMEALLKTERERRRKAEAQLETVLKTK